MIHHFLFVVKNQDRVLGYDIYDTRKNIVNHTVEPGCYLAFYTNHELSEKSQEDLINFIYKNKVLMIRKKIALKLKV
ncbi:MAG: hypothetical protein EBT71_05920 [Alphaproteobacteria bacterium]|nr:hypothetical protein [Alphaproteobacteria bacterium]